MCAKRNRFGGLEKIITYSSNETKHYIYDTNYRNLHKALQYSALVVVTRAVPVLRMWDWGMRIWICAVSGVTWVRAQTEWRAVGCRCQDLSHRLWSLAE